MKIKIANKWNKETKSYEKALYDIKESDKSIYGRFTLSAKKEEKWVNAHMSFIVFKSKVDIETINSLLRHDGKLIEVTGELTVDKGLDEKGYFKFIINSAKPLKDKSEPVQHFQERVEDDEYISF